MAAIKVRLFGKLSIVRDGWQSSDFSCGKSQELLGFLLMHRESSHTREELATLLWADYSNSQAKQCLRQTLWQLKTALGGNQSTENDLLLIHADWIGINPTADLWLDTAAFEEAYNSVRSLPPEQLKQDEIELIRGATEHYLGDLLTGCYEDWCLCERERFRDMFLVMLLKLMLYFETSGEFERGLEYGEKLLRFDHAHERTHRIMMRLRYLSGDRTGALHQYRRCREALAKELDVVPSARTENLYQQILNDNVDQIASRLIRPLTNIESATASLPEILSLLQKLVKVLPEFEERIRQDLNAIENNMKPPRQQNLFSMSQAEEKNDPTSQKRRSLRHQKDGH